MTTAWKKARQRVGLPRVRVHDLKHTFGHRLRAAGIPFEESIRIEDKFVKRNAYATCQLIDQVVKTGFSLRKSVYRPPGSKLGY